MKADLGVPVDDRAPDFLTVEEAGAVLRFSRGKVYELAREFLATGGASGTPVIRLVRRCSSVRFRADHECNVAGGAIGDGADHGSSRCHHRRARARRVSAQWGRIVETEPGAGWPNR